MEEPVNQPSGFVPVPFKKVGKLLLGLGSVGIVLFVLFRITAWLPLTTAIPIMSLVLIGIGLYLIFLVPIED